VDSGTETMLICRFNWCLRRCYEKAACAI
jgi:hypothetical protein